MKRRFEGPLPGKVLKMVRPKTSFNHVFCFESVCFVRHLMETYKYKTMCSYDFSLLKFVLFWGIGAQAYSSCTNILFQSMKFYKYCLILGNIYFYYWVGALILELWLCKVNGWDPWWRPPPLPPPSGRHCTVLLLGSVFSPVLTS